MSINPLEVLDILKEIVAYLNLHDISRLSMISYFHHIHVKGLVTTLIAAKDIAVNINEFFRWLPHGRIVLLPILITKMKNIMLVYDKNQDVNLDLLKCSGIKHLLTTEWEDSYYEDNDALTRITESLKINPDYRVKIFSNKRTHITFQCSNRCLIACNMKMKNDSKRLSELLTYFSSININVLNNSTRKKYFLRKPHLLPSIIKVKSPCCNDLFKFIMTRHYDESAMSQIDYRYVIGLVKHRIEKIADKVKRIEIIVTDRSYGTIINMIILLLEIGFEVNVIDNAEGNLLNINLLDILSKYKKLTGRLIGNDFSYDKIFGELIGTGYQE